MTEFIIEKDIPLPPTRAYRTHRNKFHAMEIGDSVFFEGYDKYFVAKQTAYNFGATHGRRFSGRKCEGGGRIWRIE